MRSGSWYACRVGAWTMGLALVMTLAPVGGSRIWAQAIDMGVSDLRTGESKGIPDVVSFEISNPNVVSGALDEGTRELTLFAESGGTAVVNVQRSGVSGVMQYRIQVQGVSAEVALEGVEATLGDIPGLLIEQKGGTVLLRGTIANRVDGRRIDFQTRGFGKVIQDLTVRSYVEEDLASLNQALAAGGLENVKASLQMGRDGRNVLALDGVVYNDAMHAQVPMIASQFFDEERVLDRVQVQPPLVEVDIEIYTLDVSRSRTIGDNSLLREITNIQSSGWIFYQGERSGFLRQFGDPDPGAPPMDSGMGGGTDDGGVDIIIGDNNTGAASGATDELMNKMSLTIGPDANTYLNWFKENGVVTNVSRQHAAVRSGSTAIITSANDIVLRLEGAEAVGTETVTAGQVLEITPTLTHGSRFETKVRAEISSFTNVPTAERPDIGISRRSVESTFISAVDEQIVMGGSSNDLQGNGENATPFLGKIPIIGWFFFKEQTRRGSETVDVYFMTLRAPVVRPAVKPAQSSEADSTVEKTQAEFDELMRLLDRATKY